jgi:hypothetical protein
MRRTHSSLLKELDVDPKVRGEQMGHTVDVNENVIRGLHSSAAATR